MEPTFMVVIIFLVALFIVTFLLIRKSDSDEKTIGHNMYKNYRKTRMDKPIL